jgi:hypothetical protein
VTIPIDVYIRSFQLSGIVVLKCEHTEEKGGRQADSYCEEVVARGRDGGVRVAENVRCCPTSRTATFIALSTPI